MRLAYKFVENQHKMSKRTLSKLFNQNNTSETYRLLEAIFEDAIDGIITINERGIMDAVNPAAASLFGYESEEVIGHNIKMLMPEPYHGEHDTYIDNYHRTGIKKIIGIGRKVQGLRKDGTIFPFRLSVSEVWMDERRVYTGFIHDVSDLEAAKQQLFHLNEELEQKVGARTEELSSTVNRLLDTNKQLEHEIEIRHQAEEALRVQGQKIRAAYEKEKELGELKSRFVSMASHEFRTPLSSILSSAGLIARYTLEEQQEKREKHVARIKSAVKNLTGILNDFLSLSKLEEGVVKLKLTEFSWEEFCREIQDEIKGDYIKKEQTLLLNHEEDDLVLYSDKRLIKNILFNLISNAIKYSPSGSTIYCSSSVKEGMLHLSVRDEGIGIPKADQVHLFSRFFRAENVSNIQGTGLGLTIVKRYVNLLGGSIQYESEEGKGTTFFVQLPIRVEVN